MALPQWLQVLEQFGPMVLLMTPAAPIVPFIVSGIKIAEQIPGATGAQKKDFATQIVAAGIQAFNSVSGKTPIDPTAVANTVSSGIDTVVGVTNLVHNHITSVQPAAPVV